MKLTKSGNISSGWTQHCFMLHSTQFVCFILFPKVGTSEMLEMLPALKTKAAAAINSDRPVN